MMMLKQSFIYSTWLYARTAILAIGTILLAKLSSISDYGSYISAIAIVGFFTPFVHGGMSYVYLDSDKLLFAKKEDCEKAWRLCLYISGIIVGLFAFSALEIFTENIFSIFIILTLAFSEISLLGICEIESRKEQLLENPIKMGFWQTIPHALRLFIFISTTHYFNTINIIEQWILSGLTAYIVCVYFSKNIGVNKLSLRLTCDFIKKSMHYGIGGSSLKLMFEIDKPIISSVSGNAITAQLSIAQRLIDFASIPMSAITSISLTRMLKATSNEHKVRIVKRSILAGCIISTFLLIVIIYISSYILDFLGKNYSYSKILMLLLVWVPAASLTRGMLGNWLATSGYAHLYSRYNMSGAVIRSTTCFPLVAYYGAIGSIIGLAISEFLIILLILNKLIKSIKTNEHTTT
jgi:O-antigen/teichoic acid export membrane protein